jgi:hypothetical protein
MRTFPLSPAIIAAAILSFLSLSTTAAMAQRSLDFVSTQAQPNPQILEIYTRCIEDIPRSRDASIAAGRTGSFVGRIPENFATDLQRRCRSLGLELDDASARYLTTHAALKVAGSHPSRISNLLKPLAANDGLHGWMGELAAIEGDKDLWYSRNNSMRVDLTRRDPSNSRRIVAYGQVKCRSTAATSFHELVRSFAKFHGSADGRVFEAQRILPFECHLPADQFDELVQRGRIDPAGRPTDLAALRDRIERLQVSPSSKTGRLTPSGELVVTGRDRIRKDPGLCDKLVFKPLPKTYDQLQVDARNYADATSKLLPADGIVDSPASRIGRRIAASSGLAGIALSLITVSAAPTGVGSISAAGGLARGAGDALKKVSGKQKLALQRVIRKLTPLKKFKMPKVNALRGAGRLAAGAAVAIEVGLAAYSTYGFIRGEVGKREFSTGLGGNAGGAAGALAGAKLGAMMGAPLGPAAAAVFAFGGALVGSFVGGAVGGAAVDSYWNSLDEEELQFSVNLFRERLRDRGIE